MKVMADAGSGRGAEELDLAPGDVAWLWDDDAKATALVQLTFVEPYYIEGVYLGDDPDSEQARLVISRIKAGETRCLARPTQAQVADAARASMAPR